MNKFEVSAEMAEAILAKRVVVKEAGSLKTPLVVGNITLSKKVRDEQGNVISEEPMYWEDPETGEPQLDRPYAIVNVNAITEEEFAKASEYFENGDYWESVNYDSTTGEGSRAMSLRMSPEDITKHNIGKGSIVAGTFDYRYNAELDDESLVCTAITPIYAEQGANSFADRAKARRKARAEAKKAQSVEENTEDQA